MNESVIKTCPACGSGFECRMNNIGQCACSKIALQDDTRLSIAKQFNDCLCNECLEKIQQEQ